jgi:hypothetical protein
MISGKTVLPFLANMKIEQVILCFHGKLSNEMLQYFIKIMDLELIEREVQKNQRKRIISVMIESLQNVIHYNSRLHQERQNIERDTYFVFFEPVQGSTDYFMLVANPVKIGDASELKQRLDTIKNKTEASLHEEQLRILEEKSVSGDGNQKQGAGIGLIDMARRCNGNFDYHFYDFKNNFKYFTIQFMFNER